MSWEFDRVTFMDRPRLIEELGATQQREYAMMLITELHHRDAKAQGDRMEAATNTMRSLTRWITGMTLINLLFVVLTWARWQP